jgi:N-acetylmuramoyl-L-alanine amidase-like protein
MGSSVRADVDLAQFATPDEITEAERAVDAHAEMRTGSRAALSDDPAVGSPTPSEVGVLPDLQASGRTSGHGVVWLPHTKAHPISCIDHGVRPETRGIVIHVNDGSFDGTISWFSQGPSGGAKGVGAHLEIGDDRVWQLAPLDRKCWHAVQANAFAIGFEHVGFGKQTRADWLQASHELAFSANRAAWVLHEYELGQPKLNHNIWPHSYGGAAWGGHACPGTGFPWDHWLAMCGDAYQAHWGRHGN